MNKILIGIYFWIIGALVLILVVSLILALWGILTFGYRLYNVVFPLFESELNRDYLKKSMDEEWRSRVLGSLRLAWAKFPEQREVIKFIKNDLDILKKKGGETE